jgi:hypothetical protein
MALKRPNYRPTSRSNGSGAGAQGPKLTPPAWWVGNRVASTKRTPLGLQRLCAVFSTHELEPRSFAYASLPSIVPRKANQDTYLVLDDFGDDLAAPASEPARK